MAREAIVLTSETGERFEFPINPRGIKISDGLSTTKVSVLGLGQVALPADLRTLTLTFETFLPRWYDATLCNYRYTEEPEVSYARLERWLGRRPSGVQEVPERLRVVATETGFSREMMVTVLNRDYRPSEPDALYLSITLEDWKRQQLRVTQGEARPLLEEWIAPAGGVSPDTPRPVRDAIDYVVETPSAVNPFEADQFFRRALADQSAVSHITRRGDSLASVAVLYYGQEGRSRWTEIYALNASVLAPVLPTANPDYKIDDGISLALPR